MPLFDTVAVTNIHGKSLVEFADKEHYCLSGHSRKRKRTIFDDHLQPKITPVGPHFNKTTIYFLFLSESMKRPATITVLATRALPRTTLEGNKTI